MLHRPIVLKNIALEFPQKTCISDFSAEVHSGARIGIIGNNGSGKSHLLRLLCGCLEPTRGDVHLPSELSTGYLPQIIECFDSFSGGQRLNKALSEALAHNPNLLCLDEPTNHLDLRNRRSLMRMLQNYRGTLILVTHDVELLESCVEQLWHVAEGSITAVTGSYSDLVVRMNHRRQALEQRSQQLRVDQKRAHESLMRDQERAKKKRIFGEKKYDGDKNALRAAQGSGQLTTNKSRKRIGDAKREVEGELQNLRLPEVLKPKFYLQSSGRGAHSLVNVRDGECGYEDPILVGVHLQIHNTERVWLAGDNGSGKTTLVRALLQDPLVKRVGDWRIPSVGDIGYLDQHYATLQPEQSASETIQACAPHWKITEVRDHLNSFLFRKNEEVNLKTKYLSGGEKARLSLAQIAAKTPRLLILDEVTNNLDLETREHIIQMLRAYPGAMIVISHDAHFVREIGVNSCYLTLASIDRTEREEPFTNFLPQVVETVLDITRP